MRKLSVHHKTVASNSFYLFVLTFSNYFLYFLTIPYQARVLGPEVFGLVGFAIAFTAYFKIVIDFGFMISATEQVSLHRSNSVKISQILSNVTYAKIFLTIVSAIILAVLCLTIPMFRDHYLLFALFFVANAAKSFQPDFVYRGIEKMRIITIRTVIVQVFFLIFLFVLVKSPSDILWIPTLEAMGAIVALGFVAMHMNKIGLKLHAPVPREVMSTLKDGLWFFYSRLAANLYTATNIFVLGLVYGPASQLMGLYASADRLVTAGKQAITPVGDALYPHMVRKKDFRLMKKVLVSGTAIMALGCAGVYIFAHQICVIIFGPEYYGAGDFLRILSIVIFLAFPGILLGFPTMSPMGLAKQANLSNIFAAGLQVTQILVLALAGELTIINVCIATCITELSVVLYRAYVIVQHRRKVST